MVYIFKRVQVPLSLEIQTVEKESRSSLRTGKAISPLSRLNQFHTESSMKLDRINDADLILYLNSRELELVLSCIRESFATLNGKEYELRVGVPIDEAVKMAVELKDIMEREGLGG